MKVVGNINNKKVVVLLDTGATHNFLNSKLASLVEGKTSPQASFNIMIGNESKLACTEICKEVDLMIHKVPFKVDLYLLPIGGVGVQVLQRIGKTTYRIALPPVAQIHPVFHVTRLQPHHKLLLGNVDHVPNQQPTPYRILRHRYALKEGRQRHEVLIEWEGPDGGTSWEELDHVHLHFPKSRAWGQAQSEEGGVDTSLPRARTSHVGTSAECALSYCEANFSFMRLARETQGWLRRRFLLGAYGEDNIISCEVNSSTKAYSELERSGRRIENLCEVKNARFIEDLGDLDLGDLDPPGLGAEDIGSPSPDEEDPNSPSPEG
ncbi:hypothetical protein EJ110_NYTH34231 [Nymphaea thermarum]|nr:hypothetical protein EJ110_NYTH34231 [Nymphaea thermarum]